MTDQRTEIRELWHKVNRGIHEQFRHVFKGSEIPPAALMFLRQIACEPGVTVSELARRTGMVKSHVSKTMDQLVQQGYVEKRTDETDLRLLRVYPSPAAAELMSQMEARVQPVWRRIVDHVPEDQLAQVEVGLRILLTALEAAGPSGNNE